MDFIKFSLAGFDEFLVYAGLAVAFIYLYLIAYLKLTPYDELKLIKDGNVAASPMARSPPVLSTAASPSPPASSMPPA